MQNCSKEKRPQNHSKNRIWGGLGLHLAGVWEGLGDLLKALGPSCSFFGWSKSSFFEAWVQDELQKASWIDF